MDSWFFLPFPRAMLDLWNRGSGRGEEPGGAKLFRLIQIRLMTATLKNPIRLSSKFPTSANRAAVRAKRARAFCCLSRLFLPTSFLIHTLYLRGIILRIRSGGLLVLLG